MQRMFETDIIGLLLFFESCSKILKKAALKINTQKMTFQLTAKYSLIHCCYWSIMCSSLNFASVFLLSKHFSNSQIGLILALANIFAVVPQPAVASFADHTSKISIQSLSALLAFFAGLLAAGRILLSNCFAALGVLLVLELTVLFTLQPLLNSLGMQLINQGVPFNFGFARGMGSMAFAVFSVILGSLVQSLGTDFLSVFSTVLSVLLGISILMLTKRQKLPKGAEQRLPSAKADPVPAPDLNQNSSGLIAFISQNRRFFLLMVAVSLTFCSHTMINNFPIQITENVGGTEREMGIAIGLAAAIELPAMSIFAFLMKKFRCSSILKFSLLFFMVKAAVTLFATNVWTWYAAQLIQCGAYALFIPASVYYVNTIIQQKDHAKGQAFVTTAITVGGVVASLFGGWLLDGPGVGGMLLAGLIFSALGLAIGLFATQKTDQKGEADLDSLPAEPPTN